MSFCEHCTELVQHEGTPTGKVEEIAGVKTYVAIPTTEYPKDKAVLFLCDVFGIELVNNLLLADAFAKNGFQVYAPDYFNGDSLPKDYSTKGITIQSWFVNHTQEQTRPTLDKVIAALQERGITSLAAVGYCFGGRYVFDLAFDGKIKVGATAHPSLLKVPEDLEKYATTNVPLLLNTCETDGQYGPEAQAKGDEILGGGKFAPGYKRTFWPGCTHGFAVRGDMSVPQIKEGFEGAFKATVEWFIQYL